MWKNGPTVCDGVGGARHLSPPSAWPRARARRCRSCRPSAHSGTVSSRSNRRDHQLAVLGVAHRVEDRVLEEQRVAREVHLRDEPRGEGRPEQREVDVGGAPGVRVVAPRVRARLDRDEAVAALVVGEAAPGAGEVRVERRRVAVDRVQVAPRRVGLPDLHERVAHRPPVAVEHAAVHDDPLAERLAVVLAGEVVVELADALVPVDRAGDLGQRVREQQQRALRRPRAGGHVVGIQVGRVHLDVVAAVPGQLHPLAHPMCHASLLLLEP